MKKSFKDYAIYFLTLVLGVAIFYMFNSLDSQQAMLQVSESQRQIVQLMIEMLGIVSVFVAVVLGLLIVYANNFLINRRKKEFGIYMTLGMGKRQISKIILLETILIGILSLAAGIVIGVFASQFMSILVGKMFEADMSNFKFVFSQEACIKTCICFAVVYVAVMIFNTFTISRYKLINLLTAIKKNEEVKIKNPVLSIFIFIIAVAVLSYAYWVVTGGINKLNSIDKLIWPILMGIGSTIAIFWSLSGFVLRLVQAKKSTYLKGTNMFVLRQLNNKINTTVISMSVICLMLFMTISVLSASLSLNENVQKELVKLTPIDLNLSKKANLPESGKTLTGKTEKYSQSRREDSKINVEETLKNNGFDMNLLKDIVNIPIYEIDNMRWSDFFGDILPQIKQEFPRLNYAAKEEIVKISDYNKIAQLYDVEQFELQDNEYIVLCDFNNMTIIRNRALQEGNILTIAGKQYIPKYEECQDGFIDMSNSSINMGIILVPDSCDLGQEQVGRYFMAANYNVNTEKEKKEIEKLFTDQNSKLLQNFEKNDIDIEGVTRLTIVEASKGLATSIVFIAIYLGIVFLIASSAILALKQLTESSDNKQRYLILRKIGCDEKMINKALFRQIAIVFILPLFLAIIHSIFGIKFALTAMTSMASAEELLPSIIATVCIIGVVYGLYFLATYLGSKNIIKEEV